MIKKIILEIPLSWLSNPIDGEKNKKFISNLLIQLTTLNIPLYLYNVPFGSDVALRNPERGTLVFSYHSHSEEKNVWHLKEAPITPLFAIDPSGYSGWADIANSEKYDDYINNLDLVDMRAVITRYRNVFEQKGISKYPQPDNVDTELPKKYIFFPLQVQNDPVSQFNRLNIIDMIEKAAEFAQKYNTHLVIKRHPFCNSIAIDKLLSDVETNNPFVKILDLNVHSLIKNAHSVLTVNSGVGIEALVHGASVYASGASEWSRSSNKIIILDDIENAFKLDPKKMDEYQEKLLGFLLSEYWLDPNDLVSMDRIIKKCIDEFDDEYGHESDINISSVLTPVILDLQGRLEYERRMAKLAVMDVEALKKIANENKESALSIENQKNIELDKLRDAYMQEKEKLECEIRGFSDENIKLQEVIMALKAESKNNKPMSVCHAVRANIRFSLMPYVNRFAPINTKRRNFLRKFYHYSKGLFVKNK